MMTKKRNARSVVTRRGRSKASQKTHIHHQELLTKELLGFLALFSHQLRTPLSIVKGYVAMLLDGTFGELSFTQKKAFEKIFTANERMIRLVNNFLDLPRIHVGTMEYNFEPISPTELLSHAVAEARLQADIKKLPIEWFAENPLPKILADRENLLQALSNILDNAIKYTKKGKISVSISKKEDHVLISISDTGVGILSEDLPKLFNKFMRGEDMRRLYREGRGLGLYIARQIIKGHDGKVWAESPGLGKGSTFFIELPITNNKNE
ncbi:MAG: HAMP domain-containing sensor histidine kinase [bacterium]|nr:HAMP domain-containing sensor histidine kinase [bacterium]